ncbi:MAG: hypothetical protein LLG06_12475 [Desulfobacteraceae bacterium]|nr:hypothetical protein [Desulfobacteraceae bacterium]
MKLKLSMLMVAAFVLVLSGAASGQDTVKSEKAVKKTKCQQKFESLDKAGAGSITLEDYMANGGCKRCSKKKAEKHFSARDKNGDGKIILDEYCPKKVRKAKSAKPAE